MPNITLSLPEDVYKIVKAHRETRWSEVARRAIERYAKRLELLDALTSDSELTEDDIAELDEKVKEGIYRHYSEKKKHEAGD
jgi:Arc/MetJ-type ribon-helix-helix transcriptional regulator